MNDACKELFGSIQAEDKLKEQTKDFLWEKTNGYTGVRSKRRVYQLCTAACICFLLTCFGGYWLYLTPTAKISIDINPSVEMNINRFDKVISVKSFNEDGRRLADALDVKYKNYEDAIEEILCQDMVVTLLSGDELLTITVVGSDNNQSAKILSGIEACTVGHHNTHCYSASSESVAPAHDMGLSCGKYRAFLELQRLNPDITAEQVQVMTMREIQERIDSLSGGSGTGGSSSDDWGNGHDGEYDDKHDDGHGNDHESGHGNEHGYGH